MIHSFEIQTDSGSLTPGFRRADRLVYPHVPGKAPACPYRSEMLPLDGRSATASFPSSLPMMAACCWAVTPQRVLNALVEAAITYASPAARLPLNATDTGFVDPFV